MPAGTPFTIAGSRVEDEQQAAVLALADGRFDAGRHVGDEQHDTRAGAST